MVHGPSVFDGDALVREAALILIDGWGMAARGEAADREYTCLARGDHTGRAIWRAIGREIDLLLAMARPARLH